MLQPFAPPPQMLIFGAVDFTAAFDRAKRDLLYRKMLDKGFPPHVVDWVRAFLRLGPLLVIIRAPLKVPAEACPKRKLYRLLIVHRVNCRGWNPG